MSTRSNRVKYGFTNKSAVQSDSTVDIRNREGQPAQVAHGTDDNSNGRHERGFMRIQDVLQLFPVSRSAWWAGVKAGRFPKPVKLGPRTTAWRIRDIHALLEQHGQQTEVKDVV